MIIVTHVKPWFHTSTSINRLFHQKFQVLSKKQVKSGDFSPNLIVFHRPKSGNFCVVDGYVIVNFFLNKMITV
jgi:hypothetical protein